VNDLSDSTSEIRSQLGELSALAAVVARDLSAEIDAVARRSLEALRGGGKLIFCGNGGSAADAQHLAAEYVVRFARARRPLSALALTTDTSVLTATGNDFGFETIFARQVEALARPGDLLILHSVSGESENLLAAADTARTMGVATVALLAKGGGRLKGRVDLALVVPSDVTARAQEIHLAIGHLVCDVVDRAYGAGA
jgi:D-sedoheptulose 7-phosphate isomerase